MREKTGEGRYHVVEASAEDRACDAPRPAPLRSPTADVPPTGDGFTAPLVSTGFLPQLLKPVTRGECEELIYNDRFWAEQKIDGRRLLLGFVPERGGALASNRRGEAVSVTPALASAVERLAGMKIKGTPVRSLCLDGEELLGAYYVFDVHMLGGRVFNHRLAHSEALPFGGRRELLDELAAACRRTHKGADEQPAVRFVPVARNTSEKRSLFERLERERGEGVVFKHRESLLHPGRPEAGGDLFKFKFQITVDCVLSVTDDRRRFRCEVFHEGRLWCVGYVSSGVRPSQYDELAREGGDRARVGEVRALYASARVEKGGQLVQPVFLRFRDDKAPEECTGAQLVATNKAVLAAVA